MTVAAHDDHAGVRRGHDLRHDQVGEQERAEVVGRPVGLEALGGEAVVRHAHDARVVDHDVDGGEVVPFVDLGGGGADAREGA